MRVCDWWRRENQLLVENWVFVDVPHALLQLGYDPLPNWKIKKETLLYFRQRKLKDKRII